MNRIYGQNLNFPAIVNSCMLFENNTYKPSAFFKQKNDSTPKDLLIISGPPGDKTKDKEFTQIFNSFPGKKIICGGSTSKIIARELKRSLKVDLSTIDSKIPPESIMDGADIISEGIITLANVTTLLKNNENINNLKKNAATHIAKLLLENQHIHFVIGTRINSSHQSIYAPKEMNLRYQAIQNLGEILAKKYNKDVYIQYF